MKRRRNGTITTTSGFALHERRCQPYAHQRPAGASGALRGPALRGGRPVPPLQGGHWVGQLGLRGLVFFAIEFFRSRGCREAAAYLLGVELVRQSVAAEVVFRLGCGCFL